MKKKLLTLLFVLVLGCIGLVGCGGSANNDETNGENSSGGKTELTWWMTYSDNGVDALKTLVEKFNAESDSYHLTMEYGGETSSVRQKLNTMSKEEYPSLICGSPDVLSDYADASYIVKLQGYLDADDNDWEEDIYTGIRNTYSDLEGNLVGGMLGISAKGWIVNVTMLEQAGYKVEDITSMEKVAEIALAAKSKGLCTYGYTPYSGNEITDVLTYQGCDVLDGGNGRSGDATKCLFTEGETGAMMTKLANLYAKMAQGGAFHYGAGGAGGKSLFLSKQLLFWGCTNSFVYTLENTKLDFEWAFVPYVGVDENAEFKDCVITEGTGLFIVNTENEKEMQGAYEFIKFVAKAENQNIFNTYRGYLPYTKEAAAAEEWKQYVEEVFPSAEGLLNKVANTPEDLKLPYSKAVTNITTGNASFLSKISTDPKLDISKTLEEITESVNQNIEILLMRGQ